MSACDRISGNFVLTGHGRLGNTWAGQDGDGRPVVLKQLVGLAPAAADLEGLQARLGPLRSSTAPIGAAPAGADLWVAYRFHDGVGAVEGARRFGDAVAAALEGAVDELHAAGLTHGALSDGNVRVDDSGRVTLLEAGLAALAGGTTSRRADRSALAALRHAMETPEPTLPPRGGLPSLRRAVGGARGAIVARCVARGYRAACVAGVVLAVGSVAAGVVMAGRRSSELSGVELRVSWTRNVATVVGPDGRVRRYSLGGPGDVLLVGRWTCTGSLPALYRPGTGQLFYLDGWPTPGHPLSSGPAVSTGIIDGKSRVVGGPKCQRVEVRP